jgi:hypothetical protein
MARAMKEDLKYYGKDHMQGVEELKEEESISGGNNSKNLGSLSSWVKMGK